MKLSVVIPVYNEKNTILELLGRVRNVDLPKEIIVVDDFSTDGTREVLQSLPPSGDLQNNFISPGTWERELRSEEDLMR